MSFSWLFGGVDELELSAPFAEVTTPVVSGRVELQRGAGMRLGMLQGGGELGQGLHQLLELGPIVVEGVLQCSGDCSKLFLSLRDASGGGLDHLGD